MAGHWSCCVDGVIYDTWDCSEKCVYTAYKMQSDVVDFVTTISNGLAKETHNIKDVTKADAVTQLRKDFELYLKKVLNENYTGKFIAEIM